MSKNGLILTSLVAAIPGAFLAVQMIMAFLRYAGGATLWTKGLSAMLLLIGAGLAVMPVGIFLFAGPKPEKKSKEAEDESAGREAEGGESAESAGLRGAMTDPNLEVVDAEADDFAMTGEVVTGNEPVDEDFDLGSEFEMHASQPGSEDELAADSEFEFEEEETPKRKKK
ncbi:MAG TPA: hypothetical protein VKU82_09340 [Planctomycetaceae bacterium]|nr:hypothetical protein [Planctomycetaceae bacterium]